MGIEPTGEEADSDTHNPECLDWLLNPGSRLFDNVYPRRKQVMAQGSVPATHVSEAWTDFLAPALSEPDRVLVNIWAGNQST